MGLTMGATMMIRDIQEAQELSDYKNQRREISEQIARNRQNFKKVTEDINEMEVKSFKDLSNNAARREKALVKVARRIETIRRQGHHIGIFGLTSTGKSTMVNSLLGRKVAATGAGETTKQITSYKGTHYTLWDAPGQNDESTYSNQECISFIKGLTRRLILIKSTIRENLNFMHLLDQLGLGYDIIVNKFDDVDEDERSRFEFQIRREISSYQLKQNKKLFFLSTRHPPMFPDWLRMVDYLTEECIDYDDLYD